MAVAAHNTGAESRHPTDRSDQPNRYATGAVYCRRKDSLNALVRWSVLVRAEGMGLCSGVFVASEATDDVAAAADLEFGQDVAHVVAGGDR